jgi:hypothetical protein
VFILTYKEFQEKDAFAFVVSGIDVVTIGINYLFQSFDPVGKNPRDYFRCEGTHNFLDDFKSPLISLTGREENSRLSQPKRKKRKKSDGAISGLKGGWTTRLRRNSSIRTKFRFDMCGRALSIWSNGHGQCFFFSPAWSSEAIGWRIFSSK